MTRLDFTKRKTKKFKSIKAIQGLGAAVLAGLIAAGCQPTPDEEVIHQKEDINKVVEKYADSGEALEGGGEAGESSGGNAENGGEAGEGSGGNAHGGEALEGSETMDEGDSERAKKLREALNAPETASFEVEIPNVGDGNTKVSAVDVPVLLPDADKLGAAIVSRADLSAEQVRVIGEKFFDGRTAYAYAPDSKEDYLKQIESANEAYNNYLEQGMTKDELVGLEMQIASLKEMMDAAPAEADIVLEPITYEWAAYSGVNGLESISGQNNEDGMSYNISAQREASFFMLSASRNTIPDQGQQVLSAKSNIEQMVQNSSQGVSLDDIEEIFSKNKCAYTKEEAVSLCMDTLCDFGISTEGLVAAKIEPLVWYNYDTGEAGDGVEGYQVYFTHGVGNVGQTLASNTIAYTGGGSLEGRIAYDYEDMYFTVDNSGIAVFFWSNPMAMGEVLTDSVALLPYDQIEPVIKEHISLAYENYRQDERLREGMSLDIDRITLGMMRIQNEGDENNYTLIPVWDVFSEQLGDYSLVTVNAMDGSVIIRENGY